MVKGVAGDEKFGIGYYIARYFSISLRSYGKVFRFLTQAKQFACYRTTKKDSFTVWFFVAGDERIELPPTVLETVVLPLN